jgi:IS5 family transposase
MWFCGFNIESELPDHSAIARWRDRFVASDVFNQAFHEINSQLDTKGLEIKNAMIVDASLIESKSRPRKIVIITVEPTDDDVIEDNSVNTETITQVNKKINVTVDIEESKDPEARWL